jgi:hypothetical protein
MYNITNVSDVIMNRNVMLFFKPVTLTLTISSLTKLVSLVLRHLNWISVFIIFRSGAEVMWTHFRDRLISRRWISICWVLWICYPTDDATLARETDQRGLWNADQQILRNVWQYAENRVVYLEPLVGHTQYYIKSNNCSCNFISWSLSWQVL